MNEVLFKQAAVNSCPEGWTCTDCGDEYSENTVDVKDYYVINTNEGTLCLDCIKRSNTNE